MFGLWSNLLARKCQQRKCRNYWYIKNESRKSFFNFNEFKKKSNRSICIYLFRKELAAVLLNTETGLTEDRFHHYVRPTLFPELSSYCVNLTGITQNLVDQQETFPVIYRKFINWLEKLQYEKGLRYTTFAERRISDGLNATFCSWSNWDLRFFFRIECERNNLGCPSYLKTWIDVRKMFDVSVPFKWILKIEKFVLIVFAWISLKSVNIHLESVHLRMH